MCAQRGGLTPLRVLDGTSSQDDADAGGVAVQVVNSQSFFIRGSTDYKHHDVLWPGTQKTQMLVL